MNVTMLASNMLSFAVVFFFKCYYYRSKRSDENGLLQILSVEFSLKGLLAKFVGFYLEAFT